MKKENTFKCYQQKLIHPTPWFKLDEQVKQDIITKSQKNLGNINQILWVSTPIQNQI